MKRMIALIVALTPLLLAQPIAAREWVDVSGEYRVEAEFINADNEQVTLKRRDGTVIEVPLAKRSHPDRLYVAERLRDIAKAPAQGEPNKAGGGQPPFRLSKPEFFKSETGRPSFSIVAKVTASNNRPIPEHSLLPVRVMFNESFDGELVDLKLDPQPIVKTSAAIIDESSDPDDFLIHYSWNVTSEQSGIKGKASGAVAKYKPGSVETILLVKNDGPSLKKVFAKTPADGGTWGLFLADRKFRRISNVLHFRTVIWSKSNAPKCFMLAE